MSATSDQMVTFSSHSGNIWCGQPEDTTSVEKPRSRVPDGNPQMVSTNDTVEETWHSITIVGRGRLNDVQPHSDRSVHISLRTSPNLGSTVGATLHGNFWPGSLVHTLLCAILPFLEMLYRWALVASICNQEKAESTPGFFQNKFRIFPRAKQEFQIEQANTKCRDRKILQLQRHKRQERFKVWPLSVTECGSLVEVKMGCFSEL